MILTIVLWVLLAFIIICPILAGIQAEKISLVLKIYLHIFLLALSIALYLFVLIIAIPYSSVKLLWKRKPRELAKYFYDAALANDMSGGVMGQEVFNDWWIRPDGVRFGAFGISISKILALNQKINTWYKFGKGVGEFLNLLDPGHLEDSTL